MNLAPFMVRSFDPVRPICDAFIKQKLTFLVFGCETNIYNNTSVEALFNQFVNKQITCSQTFIVDICSLLIRAFLILYAKKVIKVCTTAC